MVGRDRADWGGVWERKGRGFVVGGEKANMH